jgi:hypothetical protein
MKRPNHITPQYLASIFDYNPNTGDISWRFAHTNRVKSGHVVRCKIGNGYYAVQVDGHRMRAHNVAWAIHHGKFPDGVIDHINRDKTDNRISNLRDVTRCQNAYNVGRQKNNTTGYKGVSRNGSGFKAEIKAEKKSHYLGTFPSLEQAAQAYANAAKRLHGEYRII